MMEYIAQYTCPNEACEGGVIPQHNIVINETTQPHMYTRKRTVKVKCDHCGQVHKIEQARTGMLWYLTDGPIRVTDAHEIAGVAKAIDKANGVLQRMAS